MEKSKYTEPHKDDQSYTEDVELNSLCNSVPSEQLCGLDFCASLTPFEVRPSEVRTGAATGPKTIAIP